MKLHRLLGLSLCLAMVGCLEISGDLKVHEDLAFESNIKTVALKVPSGQHSVKATVEQKKLTLKLSKDSIQPIKKANGKPANPVFLVRDIVFKVPEGVKLPSSHGEVRLKAGENGQPFDLQAKLETDVDNGPIIDSTQRCSETIYRRECGPVCVKDENGRRRCHTECRDVPHTVYGTQDVRYYDETTTKTFTADVLHPQDQRLMGSLGGSKTTYDRIELQTGPCHLHGPRF